MPQVRYLWAVVVACLRAMHPQRARCRLSENCAHTALVWEEREAQDLAEAHRIREVLVCESCGKEISNKTMVIKKVDEVDDLESDSDDESAGEAE